MKTKFARKSLALAAGLICWSAAQAQATPPAKPAAAEMTKPAAAAPATASAPTSTAQTGAPPPSATTPPVPSPAASSEDKRQEAVLLQRAIDEKEAAKQRAIEAAKQRAEDKKRLQMERERSCVVKPVMTDAEIANCKDVWAEPQEAEKAPAKKSKPKKRQKKTAAAAPSRTGVNP